MPIAAHRPIGGSGAVRPAERRLLTATLAAASFWTATFAVLSVLHGIVAPLGRPTANEERRITAVSIILEPTPMRQTPAAKSAASAPVAAPIPAAPAVTPVEPRPTAPTELAAVTAEPAEASDTWGASDVPIIFDPALTTAMAPDAKEPLPTSAALEPADAAPTGAGNPAPDTLRVLDAAIRENLMYPAQARKRGVQGTAVVEIEVDASGRLLRSALSGSSGSGLLDSAALRLIAGLFPFPGLGGAFSTRIAIEYRLN